MWPLIRSYCYNYNELVVLKPLYRFLDGPSSIRSSHAALDLAAVVVLRVVVAAPQHDPAVLADAADVGDYLPREVASRDEPAARRRGFGGRQAEVEAPGVDAAGPRLPRADQVRVVPVRVLARRVVVELHPHDVERHGLQRRPDRRVRDGHCGAAVSSSCPFAWSALASSS